MAVGKKIKIKIAKRLANPDHQTDVPKLTKLLKEFFRDDNKIYSKL